MKKLLVFALLLCVVLSLASCQVTGLTPEGEYFEFDLTQEIKNWSENNGLDLGWEILIFILMIPFILIISVLIIAYILIVCVCELTLNILLTIASAFGVLVSIAMGLFGA